MNLILTILAVILNSSNLTTSEELNELLINIHCFIWNSSCSFSTQIVVLKHNFGNTLLQRFIDINIHTSVRKYWCFNSLVHVQFSSACDLLWTTLRDARADVWHLVMRLLTIEEQHGGLSEMFRRLLQSSEVSTLLMVREKSSSADAILQNTHTSVW